MKALPALLLIALPTLLPAADVETVAGTGTDEYTGDGGPATKAGIGGPFGVAVGPDGALYVCETTSHVVRRIDPETGIATTFAGTGRKGYAGDGGPATKALLNEPYEIRFDAEGNVFFVEMQNHLVRRVDARSGVISTVAGTGTAGFSGDGGPATAATMSRPHSIEIVGSHLYICDIGNHRVRRVDLGTNRIETYLGNGKRARTPNGPIAGVAVNGPRALAFDPVKRPGTTGPSMWLALREGNALYRIDLEAGTISHVAGTGKKGYTGDGGPAAEATLSGPKGASVDPRNGDVYLADTESHTVRVVRLKDETIDTVVGDGQRGDGPDGTPAKCRLDRPHGVFVDAEGRLFVGDSNNHVVRRLELGDHPKGSVPCTSTCSEMRWAGTPPCPPSRVTCCSSSCIDRGPSGSWNDAWTTIASGSFGSRRSDFAPSSPAGWTSSALSRVRAATPRRRPSRPSGSTATPPWRRSDYSGASKSRRSIRPCPMIGSLPWLA